MMQRSLRATAALIILLLLGGGSAAASAHGTWSRSFEPDGYAPYSERDGPACVTRVKLRLIAHQGSGITQLQARFQLRAPFDSGIPFLSYGDTGWIGSGFFTDDANHQAWFLGWFSDPPGGQYKVRALYRGVRDGWWNRDVKNEEDLEPLVGCASGPSLTG